MSFFLTPKGPMPFLSKGFRFAPRLDWPDINRQVCRSQYLSQSVFCDVYAAKNGSEFIRGLRAANSVRLFWPSGRAACAASLCGMLCFFYARYVKISTILSVFWKMAIYSRKVREYNRCESVFGQMERIKES